MDECVPKIDKALVFNFRTLHSESPDAMRLENDYIIDVVEKYPEGLIGACLIDPSWDERAIEESNRARAPAGFSDIFRYPLTLSPFPASSSWILKTSLDIFRQ